MWFCRARASFRYRCSARVCSSGWFRPACLPPAMLLSQRPLAPLAVAHKSFCALALRHRSRPGNWLRPRHFSGVRLVGPSPCLLGSRASPVLCAGTVGRASTASTSSSKLSGHVFAVTMGRHLPSLTFSCPRPILAHQLFQEGCYESLLHARELGQGVGDRCAGDCNTVYLAGSIKHSVVNRQFAPQAFGNQPGDWHHLLGGGPRSSKRGLPRCPHALLADLVGSLPAERVDLQLITRTQTLNVKCGRYEANIKGIDAQEFPLIPCAGGRSGGCD